MIWRWVFKWCLKADEIPYFHVFSGGLEHLWNFMNIHFLAIWGWDRVKWLRKLVVQPSTGGEVSMTKYSRQLTWTRPFIGFGRLITVCFSHFGWMVCLLFYTGYLGSGMECLCTELCKNGPISQHASRLNQNCGTKIGLRPWGHSNIVKSRCQRCVSLATGSNQAGYGRIHSVSTPRNDWIIVTSPLVI